MSKVRKLLLDRLEYWKWKMEVYYSVKMEMDVSIELNILKNNPKQCPSSPMQEDLKSMKFYFLFSFYGPSFLLVSKNKNFSSHISRSLMCQNKYSRMNMKHIFNLDQSIFVFLFFYELSFSSSSTFIYQQFNNRLSLTMMVIHFAIWWWKSHTHGDIRSLEDGKNFVTIYLSCVIHCCLVHACF